MNAPTTPRLKPGNTLAHYRVESQLGEGAMGIVYRAHDTSLDRPVALKVLRPEVSTDERFVRRFVREARAAARVSHPNLAHIYYIGEQDGPHFFAMEYVDGQDLEAIVEQEGPLALERALDVLIQAAKGLGAAHRAGVVHRDVKPSNLLLTADGVVRITDFGLAKSLEADVDATQAGLVSGTPAFMSPEQCRGRKIDHRTDVYALGLTAFYLLTGRKAYDSDSLGALLDDQIHAPLPSLRVDRPDLDDEVDDVLRRLCAKDPGDRFPDMDAVIHALEACRPRPVPPAPLVARGIAALLDALVVLMMVVLLHFVLERFLGVPGFIDSLTGRIVAPLLFAAYHLVCEARWGQTPAKWALGLLVTAPSGVRPAFRQLVPRLLLRYPWVLLGPLPWLDLGPVVGWGVDGIQGIAVVAGVVGFLVTGGRTLSDVVTRTRVTVTLSPAPADEG